MEHRTNVSAAEMEPLGSGAPRSPSVGSSRLPRLSGCLNMDLRASTRCISFVCCFLVLGRVLGLLRESREFKEMKTKGEAEELEYVSWFLLGLIVLYAIEGVVVIVLFCGARHQNYKCLYPFLMVYVVLVPVLCLVHTGIAIVMFLIGEILMGVIEVIYAIIVAGLGVWFLLLVYSYYRQLRREGPVDVGRESFMDFMKKSRTVPVDANLAQVV
ncbi:uncharacterized protein [Anabrus simplex]|uniref:uncharacterized protein n=1 Tax=Anabrus simplex TaxID=316456 RepID=UPI0034DDBF41